MELDAFLGKDPEEKPLDRIVSDGGFCGIFRTIGCIGDSLSSGEFQTRDAEGKWLFHDLFDYSWGQYLARMAGCRVYNFSRGGMTAKEYWESFADAQDYWNPEKLCQAYIIALGVNDLGCCELGGISDVHPENPELNAKTFAGYYGRIVQRLQQMQPEARFFFMTIPQSENPDPRCDAHRALLYEFTKIFPHSYVLDFRTYAPVYDAEFRENFFLYGHMNPAGYLLTAKMTASYIDFIIRHHPQDFAQAGLIGTEWYMKDFRA